MPRLVGKQSNSGLYLGTFLGLAIATAGLAEYLGVVNVVPGFGRDSNPLTNNAYSEQLPRN